MRPAAVALATLLLATAAASASGPARTRVSYVAGGSVYVEAGRLQGLAEGDTLEVLRGERVAARMVVRFLSASRASCEMLAGAPVPGIGEVVRFVARDTTGMGSAAGVRDTASAAASDSAAAPVAQVAAPPRPARAGRLRGRVGGRMLHVAPDGGSSFSQPALDLRLDGARVGGLPLDLAVDVRGHRTYYAGAGDHGATRVYRLAASASAAGGVARFTLGRQVSPSLAAVSLFDGLLARYDRPRWSAGLFAGAEPDPVDFGLATDLVDGGGFVELRSAPGSERRWSLAGGAVASFDHGHVNRDFLFLQGFWSEARWSASVLQEVDLGLGWKRDAGEPALSLTSTFAVLRWRASPALTVHGGYDTRRSVRLYRDRVTPETELDDHQRRGGWLGAVGDLRGRLRAGGEARWSGGGAWGEAASYTGTLEAPRLLTRWADLRWRTTRTAGDHTSAWLHAGTLALRPWREAVLELAAGVRETEAEPSGPHARVTWQSAALDLPLARRWYLLLSLEHDGGDGAGQMQSYSTLSWSF